MHHNIADAVRRWYYEAPDGLTDEEIAAWIVRSGKTEHWQSPEPTLFEESYVNEAMALFEETERPNRLTLLGQPQHPRQYKEANIPWRIL
jgi:hypothetical protein